MNDEIEKNKIRERTKKKLYVSTQVNLSNLQSRSWDWDNLIEIKLKNIMNNFQLTQYFWMMKLKKKKN
jgi:hypothetical protein